MEASPVQWITRLRSIRCALATLEAAPRHLLLILPTTHGALRLARELCRRRECWVIAGPVSSDPKWRFGALLREPSDIAKAFVGMPQLPRTVITFPDQTAGHDLSCAWLPFLGTQYSFSVIEALLALRHRPRVFALRSRSASGDFGVAEVSYADLLENRASAPSLQMLMSRLLEPLQGELENPPADWLAQRWLARKSAARWRFSLREELKDLECLLRLHLLSLNCDRLRTGTAVAAVVARQKDVFGAVSL